MDLSGFYPPRPEQSRKGDFGRVLVVGGSERYAGAPAFNALAALRCGADLAYVLAPRRAADIVASYAPDLITIPCEGAYPELSDVEEHLPRVDAVVIGGGIERSPKAHRALRAILGAAKKPMVVDAEALHALAGDVGSGSARQGAAEKPWPAGHGDLVRGKPALLTPHAGEFEVLAGRKWPENETSREEECRLLAERYGATVVVKGRREVVSDGRKVARDEAGSPYLTKGGYGDLLAGAAGAHLARGRSPFDAARAAAYLVGAAGELAAAQLGESTLASDALARIPDVLRRSGSPSR